MGRPGAASAFRPPRPPREEARPASTEPPEIPGSCPFRLEHVAALVRFREHAPSVRPLRRPRNPPSGLRPGHLVPRPRPRLRVMMRCTPNPIGRRVAAPTDVGVEPLEGRRLLSYLVVPRPHKVVPVHVSDPRTDEPRFSNGLAFKSSPRFNRAYTGPRRPELNGVRASAYVSGTNLVLSGTVVGTIPRKPVDASQESRYNFGIDRGGASERGPFPGREHIRFDTVVVAQVKKAGVSAFLRLTDPQTNQPGAAAVPLPASSVSIAGNTVTITVPLSKLPSSGRAVDQWNVNFFTSNPNQKPGFRGVASLTPEFTEFQVHVKPPATHD